MSYSTDPVQDADRHYGALHAQQDAQEHAESQAADDFMAACRKCDANAVAAFAGQTTDWNAARLSGFLGTPRPMRKQPLSEVMADALDDSSRCELMQLVLNVAFGNDLVNQPPQARALLSRMATAWASENVAVQA